MNFEIKQCENQTEITLGESISIRDAAEFHSAVRLAVGKGGAVCVRAAAVKSIHTSIVQILLSLAQGSEELCVSGASDSFAATEKRLGVTFKRRD